MTRIPERLSAERQDEFYLRRPTIQGKELVALSESCCVLPALDAGQSQPPPPPPPPPPNLPVVASPPLSLYRMEKLKKGVRVREGKGVGVRVIGLTPTLTPGRVTQGKGRERTPPPPPPPPTLNPKTEKFPKPEA